MFTTIVRCARSLYVLWRINVFFLLFLVCCGNAALNAQTAENNAAPEASQTAPEDYRKAVETFAKLDQSGNFTESLAYADMNVLPLGIKQTISNIQVTIAVSDVRWETNYTDLTLFCRVKIPQESKLLYFGAQGIKLSHNGDIIGDASLVLMGDISIPINGNTAALTLKGDFDKNTGRAKELTFVSVDCKGFKEMGIAAEIEFPESMLVPVNEKGERKGGRVIAAFKTIVKDWNDIIAAISLPPFAINGLDDFIFTMNEAIFDFSDFRNDPTIAYPEGYAANYLIPGNESLWRGVFVRDLSVTLPKQFSVKGRRVSFMAQNMLLDNNGISGRFTAAGVLPIDQGTASGWRFSVDAFMLALEANRLTEAGFSGMIGLPVSEKSNLLYDAIITADNEYLLKVKPMGKVSFDVFHAKAELLPNSYVELRVEDGAFRPEALLHGSLNFAARLGNSTASDTTGKKIAEFKGIEFRSLRLKTEAPMFTAEYFGYKGELKMMNFPLSVDRIGIRATGEEVALLMNMKLTLSDNLFTGSTGMEFIAKLNQKEDSEGRKTQKWEFDKLKINNVAIDATVSETFKISGSLIILDDDPVYGDGFSGKIDLTFGKGLKGFNATARAMFGKKDFRYWFVDARVKLPGTGLPVFPPLNLNGFGGGVSYRMKRSGVDLLGAPSGCKYVPDENTGLGVKAAVLFNVANDAAINGEASFEIAFSRSGGLSFLGFYGYAKFVGKIPGTENIENFVGDKMKKVAELEEKFVAQNPALAETLQKLKQYEPNKAAANVFEPSEKPGEAGFAAALGIQYDFTQNSFHATFDLYVNAIGGMVRGTASGNRAGWAVMHMDPKEWYVHMGTPTDRLGLKMGIGNILTVETGSYLMLGSRIPGSPPPPREVADILGVDLDQLDYMRDLNALGDGKGFAFGASLKVATGDISFLILYANFQAGLGFDIMLKDYQDAQCKGRSGPIGFDGWYANGQAYTYLQGELGVKVNLWFLKTKIPIIKGAAAALLQAQLPNPVFFRGYLGVKFSLLGGLVSGNCRFKLTLGEQCELVVPGSSPLDMRMISDLTPKKNSDAVDVFAAPQAAFNMRVGVPFDMEDDQGPKTFRIQLNEFSVTDGGQPIQGKLVWTQNKDGVSFFSHEVLPPKKTLRAVVKVGFEQWQNNRWVVVYTAGQKAEESMEVTFTTGTAPDVIPLQNIEYAYPVVDQKFYLKDESHKGYIQLKRGQSYLFTSDYKHEIQVTEAAGTKHALPFTYTSSNNRIDYTMPDLGTQQSFKLRVVTLSKGGAGSVTDATVQSQSLGTDSDVITVSNAQASDVVRDDIGKSLLDYSFTTSRYSTFAEKMAGNAPVRDAWQKISSTIVNLAYEINVTEPFDPIDLAGSDYTAGRALIEGEATLTDNFYRQAMHPLLYQHYPLNGNVIFTHREPAAFGVPPARAITLLSGYLTEIENGVYTGYASRYLPYIYALPHVYQQDFYNLQTQLVNQYVNDTALSRFSSLINGICPSFSAGTYTVQFRYIMPDGTKGTTVNFDYVKATN